MTAKLNTLARVVETATAYGDADTNHKTALQRLRDADQIRNDALREAYAAGVKVVDLVDLLEEAGAPLGRQQVHRIVSTVGRPDLDITQVAKDYANGASVRSLTQQHRVSAATLKKALQDAGVELRDRADAIRAAVHPQPASFDVATAIERYRRGESIKALSADYRCSPRMVRRELEAAGVEIRERETAKQLARGQATA